MKATASRSPDFPSRNRLKLHFSIACPVQMCSISIADNCARLLLKYRHNIRANVTLTP